MDGRLIFSEVAGDPAQRVRVETFIYESGLTEISVAGVGSIKGMRASSASFDRGFAALGRGDVWVRLVLTDFEGAPLPAQLSLVKWMIQNQRRLRFIGILGGDTTAVRVARAIQGLLPFGHRVAFFDSGEVLDQRIRQEMDGSG